MSQEHIWALFALFVVAIAAFGLIWARALQWTNRMALREMIHKERMAAIEKGVALPEIPSDPAPSSGSDHLTRAALLGGLVLLFGGIGLTGAFFLIPDDPTVSDLQLLAPLGLLPVFVGLGLLLYAWLDRRSRRERDGDGAS